MKRMIAALAALAPLTATPAQVPAPGAYDTAQVAPGSWGYQPAAGGSLARFVDSGGIARLVLQCSRATRRVSLSHTSAAPAATLFVWTSSLPRGIPARFEPNAMRVTAQLAATDPLLDAIAFSRGRIAVQLPGAAALVVATAPEAARVIEDCRS